jgi:hypothetical protein
VRSLSPKLSKVCYIIESKLKGIMSPHMITIFYANFVDIFKEFSILPVACLYIPEILCYAKKYKESVEQNVQICNYSM